jgi:hypothetical protein
MRSKRAAFALTRSLAPINSVVLIMCVTWTTSYVIVIYVCIYVGIVDIIHLGEVAIIVLM